MVLLSMYSSLQLFFSVACISLYCASYWPKSVPAFTHLFIFNWKAIVWIPPNLEFTWPLLSLVGVGMPPTWWYHTEVISITSHHNATLAALWHLPNGHYACLASKLQMYHLEYRHVWPLLEHLTYLPSKQVAPTQTPCLPALQATNSQLGKQAWAAPAWALWKFLIKSWIHCLENRLLGHRECLSSKWQIPPTSWRTPYISQEVRGWGSLWSLLLGWGFCLLANWPVLDGSQKNQGILHLHQGTSTLPHSFTHYTNKYIQ